MLPRPTLAYLKKRKGNTLERFLVARGDKSFLGVGASPVSTIDFVNYLQKFLNTCKISKNDFVLSDLLTFVVPAKSWP